MQRLCDRFSQKYNWKLYVQALTFENAEKLKSISGITSVKRMINKKAEDGVFPDFKDGNPSVTNNWTSIKNSYSYIFIIYNIVYGLNKFLYIVVHYHYPIQAYKLYFP